MHRLAAILGKLEGLGVRVVQDMDEGHTLTTLGCAIRNSAVVPALSRCTHTHTHTHTQRERERERERDHMAVPILNR